MSQHRTARRALLAGSLLIILALWPVLYIRLTEARQASPAPQVSLFANPAFAAAAGGRNTSIADVAEKAVDSVVNISINNGRGGGSGVIVSDDGIVITNNHVIRTARTVSITTADGREFGAKLIGNDRNSDLAVLRLINADEKDGSIKGLSPMRIGDSSALRLGEVVLAIGNPLGVGQTVTMGIVSAKDRQGFVQTDAAINPGNSGGALVNMNGELVGINSFIVSKTGGSQGLGFAIPSNTVEPIVSELLQDGRSPWLGVTIQTVDRQIAARLDLEDASGVLVTGVMENSPADQAGIEPYDVVTKIGSTKVKTADQLKKIIVSSTVGKSIDIYVQRGDAAKKLRIGLIAREDADSGDVRQRRRRR